MMLTIQNFSFGEIKKIPLAIFSLTMQFQFTHSKNWIHYLGVLIALGLHMILFLNSPKTTPQFEKLTQPSPMSVSWISFVDQKKDTETLIKKPFEYKPIEKTKIKKFTQNKQKLTPVNKEKLITSTQQQTTQTNAIEMLPKLSSMVEKTAEITTSSLMQNIENSNMVRSSNNSESVLDDPVVLPNLNASYLQNPAPAYPSRSRQNGEQGKVFIRAFVNEAGKVEKIVLKKSSNYERLDNAALETVKTWRFVPAHRGDVAVSAWVIVPILFNLEG